MVRPTRYSKNHPEKFGVESYVTSSLCFFSDFMFVVSIKFSRHKVKQNSNI